MQDQRLLFRLLKQKFVELLRRNTGEGRREALGAPPALVHHLCIERSSSLALSCCMRDLRHRSMPKAWPTACMTACNASLKYFEGVFVGCLRRELAPLALNAYPEAYGELKRSLLLLVYGQHEEGSPVGAEWSPRSRSDLAAMLCRTLRQAAGRALSPAVLLLNQALP